jgi:hypothetical protein
MITLKNITIALALTAVGSFANAAGPKTPTTQVLHLLDTGHFALEEDGAVIASLIRDFLGKQLTE